jgi:hypothetical protein
VGRFSRVVEAGDHAGDCAAGERDVKSVQRADV